MTIMSYDERLFSDGSTNRLLPVTDKSEEQLKAEQENAEEG